MRNILKRMTAFKKTTNSNVSIFNKALEDMDLYAKLYEVGQELGFSDVLDEQEDKNLFYYIEGGKHYISLGEIVFTLYGEETNYTLSAEGNYAGSLLDKLSVSLQVLMDMPKWSLKKTLRVIKKNLK